VDEQVRRLADQVYETICQNEDEFLVAEGTAVLTVFKHADQPRIELHSRKMLVGVGGPRRPASARRLSGEVRLLADDVRRAMISNDVMVRGAREVVIEIHLRGPRPSFDFSYKPRRA
jgi:hypothetical protein